MECDLNIGWLLRIFLGYCWDQNLRQMMRFFRFFQRKNGETMAFVFSDTKGIWSESSETYWVKDLEMEKLELFCDVLYSIVLL